MCAFFNKQRPSAKVVDGALILSLPGAINPVVWRMELGQARASALEVREPEAGRFTLTLKTPKGESHDIAPFDTRAKALAALMSVSHAMQHAHGKTAPRSAANDPAVAPSRKGGRKWIYVAVAAFAVVGLYMYLASAVPPNPALETAAGTASPAQTTTGVPVSAEDFLKGY